VDEAIRNWVQVHPKRRLDLRRVEIGTLRVLTSKSYNMAKKLELTGSSIVCTKSIAELSLTPEEIKALHGADWDIDHP
jgi:hypothetical protein